MSDVGGDEGLPYYAAGTSDESLPSTATAADSGEDC